MKSFGKATILALATVGASSAYAVELVTNGSFESGVIGNDTYQVVGAGDTFLTGWTVGGTSVDVTSGPNRWVARDGNQSVDIAGTPGPASLSQTLATSATQYVVKFSLSANQEGNDGPQGKDVKVTFGSNTVTLTGINNPTWTDYSYVWTGDAGSTLLDFTTLNNGFYGTLIDSVSVQAVPEPGTMAVLGLGVLAALRRRRAK
jgi:choice-of-anchor C domain-containing protein